jgi:hypothetical protein
MGYSGSEDLDVGKADRGIVGKRDPESPLGLSLA